MIRVSKKTKKLLENQLISENTDLQFFKNFKVFCRDNPDLYTLARYLKFIDLCLGQYRRAVKIGYTGSFDDYIELLFPAQDGLR